MNRYLWALAPTAVFLSGLSASAVGQVTTFKEQQSYTIVNAKLSVSDSAGAKPVAPLGSVFKVTAINSGTNPTLSVTFTKIGDLAGLSAEEQNSPAKVGVPYTVVQADAQKTAEPTEAGGNSGSFSWDNFGFGVALAVAYHGSSDKVTAAQVDGAGIVRATNEQSVSSSVLMELHCFDCHIFDPNSWVSSRSMSPFVAIQVAGASSQVLNGIGYGIMWGFKNQAAAQKSTLSSLGASVDKSQLSGTPNSMNIGIGVLHEFGVQQLSSGIQVNQPLPSGVTQITYKTATRTSPILLFSFAWE